MLRAHKKTGPCSPVLLCCYGAGVTDGAGVALTSGDGLGDAETVCEKLPCRAPMPMEATMPTANTINIHF